MVVPDLLVVVLGSVCVSVRAVGAVLVLPVALCHEVCQTSGHGSGAQ